MGGELVMMLYVMVVMVNIAIVIMMMVGESYLLFVMRIIVS